MNVPNNNIDEDVIWRFIGISVCWSFFWCDIGCWCILQFSITTKAIATARWADSFQNSYVRLGGQWFLSITGVLLILIILMAYRFYASGKFMPAGLTATVATIAFMMNIIIFYKDLKNQVQLILPWTVLHVTHACDGEKPFLNK